MNGRSLEAIAATIPVPVDGHGRHARAYARWDPTVGYLAAFALDGGRCWGDQVGPAFPKPADAARLAALINGDPSPATRPAPALAPYRDPGPEAEGDPGPPERPVRAQPEPASESAQSAASGTPPRTCVSCGRALPPGSRPQRRFCGGPCRAEASRHLRAPQPAAPAASAVSGARETPAAAAADQLALSLG